MDAEKRIWILLGKKENQELSAEEQAELEQLFRDHPSIAAANAVFNQILENKIRAVEQHAQPGDSWSLIKNRMAAQDSKKVITIGRGFSRFIAAASVMLIVITASIYTYHHFKNKTSLSDHVAANQVSTPLGSRSKIVLPDGTKVWLNAGSRISYNDFQNAQTREVSLSGEAYFDVVHNETQPFVVHTAGVDIRDVGTVFTVKAYPHEKNIETTLLEGSVEVTDHRYQQKKFLLQPNEKLTIYVGEVSSISPKDTVQFKIAAPAKNNHGLLAETAWIDNKLVFNNEHFHELAGRMERWYNVQFHFEDERVAMIPFSGTIENETLEQALQAMQFSTPFHYRLAGNEVWITP